MKLIRKTKRLHIGSHRLHMMAAALFVLLTTNTIKAQTADGRDFGIDYAYMQPNYYWDEKARPTTAKEEQRAVKGARWYTPARCNSYKPTYRLKLHT